MEMETLKTPALILDIERARRNASRMAKRISGLGAGLRPHVKTHKAVEIARLQTAGQGSAITVSTLMEARAFAREGFHDILYAVPIEPGKFDEAIELAGSIEHLALITDSPEIPAALNERARRAGIHLNLFLKIDCGYHRCGVEPESKEAQEIPRRIQDASNLNFAGILTHAGHSYHCRTREEIIEIARRERDVMVETAERLRSMDIPVPVVSVGSTPTMTHIDHLEGVDEARPGNYIFFDAFQARLGSCSLDDCALTVLAAVVHRDPSRRKIILDAGAIALSKDRGAVEIDETCGYGVVQDLEGRTMGARLEGLSQEHGQMFVEDDSTFERLKVGARVRVLANHSCLTAAQHAHYNVLEAGRIVDRWEIKRGW